MVLSNEDEVVEEDIVNVSPNHTYVYDTPSPHTLTTDPDTNETIRSSFSYDKVRCWQFSVIVISLDFSLSHSIPVISIKENYRKFHILLKNFNVAYFP